MSTSAASAPEHRNTTLAPIPRRARKAGSKRFMWRSTRGPRFFAGRRPQRLMFVVYAAFTLAVVTVSSAFLMTFFGRAIEEEVLQSSEHLLRQLQTSSDALLASTTTAPLAGFMMANPGSYYINNFLLTLGESDSGLLLQTYHELTQMAISYRYIESIYLYRRSDDTLISSREGLVLNASSADTRKREFTNYGLLERATVMSAARTWVSPAENADYWPDKPIASLIQTVPMFPTTGGQAGFIVINVDVEAFVRAIGGGREPQAGSTFAIDPAGRLFLHTDPRALLSPVAELDVLTDTIRTERGFAVRTVGRRNTAILWTSSEISDWVYVSYLPMDSLNRQVFRSRQVTLFFVGLIAILSLVGVEIISVCLYRFIVRLSGSARRRLALQGFDTEDPAFLDSVIDKLNERAREVEAVNDRNRVLAAYKLSLDLLYGNISGADEVRERGTIIGREIDLPCYSLVIIEPDARYYERLSFEQREYIRYRALEIAEGHFVGRCNTAAANVPMDHVVLILNFRSDGNICSRMGDLLMNLRTEIGLDQNIVVSDTTEHPADIRQLYERARERLGYRFLLGYGNILTPESVEAIEEASAALPFDTLRQYEVLLRARRYDELKAELKVLLDAIAACRYSLPIVRNIRYEIVNLIAWMSEEQRLEARELGKHRLLAESREISFLSVWREWVFHVIDVYGENCSLRKVAVKNEFLDRITAYIRNHLDHELSLQSVASAFSVSQSHLSRLFKQGEGIGFREFVLSAKIARARELLTDETDLTITEIARSLGYHDLAYFARIFRENCGMTPSEYRRTYAEYGGEVAGAGVDDRG